MGVEFFFEGAAVEGKLRDYLNNNSEGTVDKGPIVSVDVSENRGCVYVYHYNRTTVSLS